jgi:hypothetical protein
METPLRLDILTQPDDTTCGPTCLHAIYGFYGDTLPLDTVVTEAHSLKEGGTLDVFLANHALRRGYEATIYTYNLQVFDPTWFSRPGIDLAQRLHAQLAHKHRPKLAVATSGYLEFLRLGGSIRFENLTTALIRRYLKRSTPILTGLSATYLYGSAREFGPKSDYDDLRGEPTGHFVVLCSYEPETRRVLIADPLEKNPVSGTHHYEVDIDRVLCAILLGIVTYDANLLVIEPVSRRHHKPNVRPDHRT